MLLLITLVLETLFYIFILKIVYGNDAEALLKRIFLDKWLQLLLALFGNFKYSFFTVFLLSRTFEH